MFARLCLFGIWFVFSSSAFAGDHESVMFGRNSSIFSYRMRVAQSAECAYPEPALPIHCVCFNPRNGAHFIRDASCQRTETIGGRCAVSCQQCASVCSLADGN
jgi:hypothetical protein